MLIFIAEAVMRTLGTLYYYYYNNCQPVFLSRVAENALFIHDKFLDVGRYRLLLQYQSSRCKPQHHACSMDFIGYQQAVDIEEYSCAKRAFRDRGWGEIKRRLLELVHNKKIVKFSSYLRFS